MFLSCDSLPTAFTSGLVQLMADYGGPQVCAYCVSCISLRCFCGCEVTQNWNELSACNKPRVWTTDPVNAFG